MMISLPLRQSKFLIFLFFLIKTLNAHPTYILSYCYTSGNYTANSPYKSSLASLMSGLRSQSSNKGFYHYTWSSSLTTTVYGEYLCRGDISSSTCETCVSKSSINILLECPVQNEAIIWYEECFLRYSNRKIWSIYDDDGPFVWSQSYDTMMYPNSFMNTVEYRMDKLIEEAYSTSSYFAEETNHESSLEEYDLHGLVQCTPDLDKYDCYRCLKSAYNETEDCCYGKQSTLVYTTNCMLTYEATILAPPPPPPLWENIPDSPPPPPPPPLSLYARENIPNSDAKISLKLKGKVFRKIIASVIAAVIMIFAICLCSLCCCCIKKKHQTQERGTSIELTPTNDVDNPIVDQTMAKTETP